MYAVGQVSPQAAKLMADAKTAMEIGIAQVFPDNQFGNIGYEIANFAEKK